MRRATQTKQTCRAGTSISIHALLAESDKGANRFAHAPPEFLSTLSLRRATPASGILRFYPFISIHALLAESDRLWACPDGSARLFLSTLSLRRATTVLTLICPVIAYFYPRSPCGERHSSVSTADQEARFLSTLSLRRATLAPNPKTKATEFLSTLSLRRATKQDRPTNL